MQHLVNLSVILWLCAAYAALGQGDVKTGDAVVIKSSDRLKGVVLCFAPSQLCGGCSPDLDAIASECQQRGVPMRVYLQDPGFGTALHSLAEDRSMVSIHDDELGVYARLYRVARSPFAMVVSSKGIIEATGLPGVVGFEVDPFLEAIRTAATAGSGDIFFGPVGNRARYARTLYPNDGDTLVGRLAFKAYFPERKNTLLSTKGDASRLLLIDSNGKVVSENHALPTNIQYDSYNPIYFAQSVSGDSILVRDWSMTENRRYLYWLRLADNWADTIPVPNVLEKLLESSGSSEYHQSSKTSFFALRFDEPSGRKLDDRSLIFGLGPNGYRRFGLRPQIYDTDSILPVESGTHFALHGDHLWVISQFRDSLTRYNLRTWDSITTPIGLSSAYNVDPRPMLAEHYRDPVTRRTMENKMSLSIGMLSDPRHPLLAVKYMVPISRLTGKVVAATFFDFISVVVLVDTRTGLKIQEIEFPQAVVPFGFQNGQFVCAAYYGSSMMVKVYDRPIEMLRR